ncbi:endoplasmic reticulum lectin 1 [Cylas formicarius]|uniref:endoplasmic reticulum lectin 1 n=1 Tax=Cylas formicarius TaxID=197179 RepID=UPI002958C4A0|nr:endoplasmic reticulum lectin 1 [Cylas formicarius]
MYSAVIIAVFLYICNLKTSLQNDIQGFDDTIVFDIDWPGKLPEDYNLASGETILVTSSMQEKYKCVIPNLVEKNTSPEEPYSGPGPLELISPLITQKLCSFRLESYWDYEVCHGRYIRQYHEEREGKKVKMQEYILGKWDEKYFEKMLEIEKKERDDLKDDEKVPTKKIDNVNLPYFEITMENGTACDLNQNKPRVTKVLYVCHVHGKHEIYLFKETSTCLYEIIILTPYLCSHPKYKPKDTGELKINCYPMDGAYDKPYNLIKLKHDSAKLRPNFDLDNLKVELIQFDNNDAMKGPEDLAPTSFKKIQNSEDASPVFDFLKGEHCLFGGTGWWKFEFCYGKSVTQYHIEKDGTKTSINLGVFDEKKHLQWLKDHPHKRPKPVGQRKQLSHLYSGGSICDKTGKPRQTEVKLKCLENPAHPSSVSLYLLEPKYCEYILGVESPIICEILDNADENGLVAIAERDTDLQ